jgi:hypothetical protein
MSDLSQAMSTGGTGRSGPASPNFGFLVEHDPLLVHYAAQAERYVFENAVQSAAAAAPAAQMACLLQNARSAGEDLGLDEADTRKLIDQQLRDAGWEADTQVLRFGKGGNWSKNSSSTAKPWTPVNSRRWAAIID